MKPSRDLSCVVPMLLWCLLAVLALAFLCGCAHLNGGAAGNGAHFRETTTQPPTVSGTDSVGLDRDHSSADAGGGHVAHRSWLTKWFGIKGSHKPAVDGRGTANSVAHAQQSNGNSNNRDHRGSSGNSGPCVCGLGNLDTPKANRIADGSIKPNGGKPATTAGGAGKGEPMILGISIYTIALVIISAILGAWLYGAGGVTGILAHIRLALIAAVTWFTTTVLHDPANSAAVTTTTTAAPSPAAPKTA